MQSSLSQSSVQAPPVVESENNLQRPPYFDLLGNQFIQQLLSNSGTSSSESEAEPAVINTIRNLPEPQLFSALYHINPLGIAPIFQERGWGVAEFIRALPQLPERLILELDALGSALFDDSMTETIDKFLPPGLGFYIQGFLDTDLDCFHTSDSGMLTMMRTDQSNIHVESRQEHGVGFGATAGGKSDLFGRSWDTEVEGHTTAGGYIFEVYDFPIQNPLLLLPFMTVNGAFSVDMTQELLSLIAPNDYKSYRQSVTYGIDSQIDALAEYNLENPNYIDLCLAFGLNAQTGFELHLPKRNPNELQYFELSTQAGIGFNAESALLLNQRYGIPVNLINQAAELGARISGHWDPQSGVDGVDVQCFELLSAHNPTSDTEMQQQSGSEVALAWDLDTDVPYEDGAIQWPSQLRINLIRCLDLGLHAQAIAPTLAPALENIGIDIHSQLQLSLSLVVPQTALISLWNKLNDTVHSPTDFLENIQKSFSEGQSDWLQPAHLLELIKDAQLTHAQVRALLQAETNATLKGGFIAGLGLEGAAAVGSFQEFDLLSTEAAQPLQASLPALSFGTGMDLN